MALGDYFTQQPQGWICPRCGKVHAPWIASCDCHKATNNTVPKANEVWPIVWPHPDTNSTSWTLLPHWKIRPL